MRLLVQLACTRYAERAYCEGAGSDWTRSALDGHALLDLADEHSGDELCLVPVRRLNGHLLGGREHGDHGQTPAGYHLLDFLDGGGHDDGVGLGDLVLELVDDFVVLVGALTELFGRRQRPLDS